MSVEELLRYWPRDSDVDACVKTDAEAASEAVSLAVHQPMRFEKRVIGAGTTSQESCDEHELLNAFMSKSLPEGRIILPIVGSSGVGKSHVIRWLDAQIRRLSGNDRRVVIRIPKNTSLKGVLGILLDKLQGPQYEPYRAELLRAQQELNPREAAGMLCEMLAQSLEEMAQASRARLTANPADRIAQERDAFCRPSMMPALLRNQSLRNHFVQLPDGSDGVVKRLVEQLTEERAAGSEDDRKHSFVPDDLLFDGIDRDALGRDEAKAITQLEREDRRVAATRVLNAALDGAKQKLLRVDPTVSDLFEAVRKQLLNDGKELILLIEDFAVISGIQKQLLQIIIKEAVRDGRQVLCSMRTALAYTSGYLDTDTVLTRANVEYRIPDEPGSEEDILNRIGRLVGAYLNAARHGQATLEREYLQGSSDADLRAWIPRFSADVEPETRATLAAFGHSNDDYEFFPFNRFAIEELAREGCRSSGRLVYNPRFVIQNVLNKVLRHRDLFSSGQFPPQIFGTHVVAANITDEIARRVPAAQRDRYLRFLAYWAGSPTTPNELLAIDARIFSAFGLDKVLISGKRGGAISATSSSAPNPRPTTKQVDVQKEVTPPIVPTAPRNPVETRWERLLEEWRRGNPIPQAEANSLRKWIAEAFRSALNWDWYLFRPQKEDYQWFTRIFLPLAGGGGGLTPAEAMVTVCTEEERADETTSARIMSTLMAIVRIHGVHERSWNFEEADTDVPRYGAFLEHHLPRVRTFIQARYFKAEWDPVPALVNGLLVGARALGVEGSDKDADDASLVNVLFAPPPAPVAPHQDVAGRTDDTGWIPFTTALAKCRAPIDATSRERGSWDTHLLNLVGARQGGAELVHAIDVARLKSAIAQTTSNWSLSETVPSTAGSAELTALRATYADLKRLSSAVNRTRDWLVSWHKRMAEWLGDLGGSDKEELLRDLKSAVEEAKAAGLTADVDTRRLLKSVEEFRTAKVVAALTDAEKLQTGTNGAVLAVLGKGYEPVARVCDDLRERYEEFLLSVDAELRSEEAKYGADPVSEARGDLSRELTSLKGILSGAAS